MRAGVNDSGECGAQLAWLYGLEVHGIKLGLTNITELLRRLGNPELTFRSLHVAGSDGKGSTCAILDAVLRKAGFNTGLYTSPHVLRFNERIAVGGVPITDAELAVLVDRVRFIVETMQQDGFNCTFFEVTTAIAFCYFRDRQVEYAVLEVGMGGRFDATNVVVPVVSIINNISLEHTEYLGHTIRKIAFEKAGIIKPEVPCVTINPEPAFSTIAAVAETRDAPLTRVLAEDISVIRNDPAGPTFSYQGEEYTVCIPGRNEAKNGALALTALRQLPEYADRIAPCVRKGMAAVRWPCRLERLAGTDLLVDVTHTEAGCKGLASDVSELYGHVVLVFGVLKDKDVDGLCRDLAGVVSHVIVTAPVTVRARPVAETASTMAKYFPGLETRDTVGAAIQRAREVKAPDELILVTGSFYMAEGALRWLGRTFL